jgi:hypothetical protein
MVDMRTRFSKYMVEEIRSAFGEHIFSHGIRGTISIRESQAKGISVLKHNPKSKGALDYLMLTQEILGKTPAQPAPTHADIARLESRQADRLRDFTLRVPNAKEVHLVGDFNNWCVSNNSLLWQKEEGVWQKRVFLEPGCYRYKFVIDGQWATDPFNERLEPNPYGGVDSVIEIE